MVDSILDDDDYVGFCTLIETTKSRLFSYGCDIASEPPPGDDHLWFSARVPVSASEQFTQLRRIVDEGANRFAPKLEDATPILIQIARTPEILGSGSERQAKLANTLINRFLRAYEHTYFDVWVPRHRLDGRAVVLITYQAHCLLEYRPIVLEMTDVLDAYLPSHVDVEQIHLQILMGSPEAISPSWRILVDGARHFESGNFREAVLCACSAAEIVASPAVERWLNHKTLTGRGDNVRSAVREMGNPLRFELCISGACTNAFADIDKKDRVGLLAELTRMNTLRNAVVHRGEEPEPLAAAAALRAAATFVCRDWLAGLCLEDQMSNSAAQLDGYIAG
jgi:hypothetical protein